MNTVNEFKVQVNLSSTVVEVQGVLIDLMSSFDKVIQLLFRRVAFDILIPLSYKRINKKFMNKKIYLIKFIQKFM